MRVLVLAILLFFGDVLSALTQESARRHDSAFGIEARQNPADDPDALVVTAEGVASLNGDAAAAEEEAIWDAKRNAVERAAGVLLRARTTARDFELEEDEIRSRTAGFIRQWEVVPNSRRVETVGGARLLRLKVRATVALLPVIRRLADIKDVYDDLERPRVRVQVDAAAQRMETGQRAKGKGQGVQAFRASDVQKGAASSAPTLIPSAVTERVRDVLDVAFAAQGFEMAASGPAEIVLAAHLELTPTVKLGDRNTPYGIGESVAACRARLTLQVVSTVSEEVLLTARAEAVGKSFQSDADAQNEAAGEAAERLLAANDALLVQRLLVRWARERQEGHVVVVEASGLDAPARALLSEQVRDQRGFRKMLSATVAKNRLTLRFLTRLDTRAVRQRLAAFQRNHLSLAVLNSRGPRIVCAAVTPPRLSRK